MLNFCSGAPFGNVMLAGKNSAFDAFDVRFTVMMPSPFSRLITPQVAYIPAVSETVSESNSKLTCGTSLSIILAVTCPVVNSAELK